jgi:hypothetical protein
VCSLEIWGVLKRFEQSQSGFEAQPNQNRDVLFLAHGLHAAGFDSRRRCDSSPARWARRCSGTAAGHTCWISERSRSRYRGRMPISVNFLAHHGHETSLRKGREDL